MAKRIHYNYKGKDINATFASMVEKFDEGVGKLIKALDEQGLREQTLIVFGSDNGGISAISGQAPYRAGKGSYYEGGVRIPMVMSWPSKIKADSKCDTPVCSIDFYPTFLAVAKGEIPKDKKLDGVNLLPLMTQSGSLAPRILYWHFPIYLQAYSVGKDDGRDPLFRTRPGSTLLLGNWKLHEYFEDGTFELYDLSKDTGERNNLASTMPEKVAELKKALIDWRSETKGLVPTELNSKYDPNASKEKKEKKSK